LSTQKARKCETQRTTYNFAIEINLIIKYKKIQKIPYTRKTKIANHYEGTGIET
jgi:hypothetical protein